MTTVLCGCIMPNMWSFEVKTSREARQARLLAFFNCLTNKDKGLVLKILEVIQKEKQDINEDSLENDFGIGNPNTANPLNRTCE